jgi:hypothetical protein
MRAGVPNQKGHVSHVPRVAEAAADLADCTVINALHLTSCFWRRQWPWLEATQQNSENSVPARAPDNGPRYRCVRTLGCGARPGAPVPAQLNDQSAGEGCAHQRAQKIPARAQALLSNMAVRLVR